MRAVADDQQASMVVGIKVPRVFALSWAIAGLAAAAGGIIWGNQIGVDTFLALVGLKVFPVVILGGLDSIGGAIIGGLLMGVIESLAAGYLDPSGRWRHEGFHSIRAYDPGFICEALRLFRT